MEAEKYLPSSSALTCNLPGDVMFEILYRLPVKSLMRFKCVNKSWYSLVKHPVFVKIHYEHWYKLRDWGELVLGHDEEDFEVVILDREIDYRRGRGPTEPMGICQPNPFRVVEVSKGLICMTPRYLRYGIEFVVINPALREHKITTRELTWEKSDRYYLSFGFGFDQKDDDFKIVRVEGFDGASEISINIYSLYVDSWRQVKCSVDVSLSCHIGVLYCNSMYWSDNDGRKEIIVFNLTSERFYTIPMPHESEKSRCWRIQPWEDDSIAVILKKPSNGDCFVWTTTPSENPETPCIWKKDIPFFPKKIYESRRKRAKTIGIRYPGYKNILPIWRYKESLVPVKRDDRRFLNVMQRLKDRFSLTNFGRIHH